MSIKTLSTSFLRAFRQIAEICVIGFLKTLTTCLPLRHASNFAGWIGRTIIPLSSSLDKISRVNLLRAFPGLSETEIKNIQQQSFDNMMRTIVEYFYIDKLSSTSDFTFEVVNEHYMAPYSQPGTAAIVFSGHYGNWEIGAWYASQQGYPLTPIYRATKSSVVNNVMMNARSSISDGIIPKSSRVGRDSLSALKQGKKLVLLADQKMKGGLDVPFFGYPSLTATGIARLARATKAPLIPTRVTRRDKLHFIVEFFPPITYENYADKSDVELLSIVNEYLESWIREYPSQWFWNFRRWDKSLYRK